MVHFCAVSGCSNRSDRETHLSFHHLPLKNKKLLKQWIHKIGRAHLPINESTRICCEHFVNSNGRLLRSDEVPSQKLPVLPTRVLTLPRRRPIVRITPPESSKSQLPAGTEYKEVGVNTDLTGADIHFLERELSQRKYSVQQLNNECMDLKEKQHLRLKGIGDDNKVRFYTGFATLSALMCASTFWENLSTNYITGQAPVVQLRHKLKQVKAGKEYFLPSKSFSLCLSACALDFWSRIWPTASASSNQQSHGFLVHGSIFSICNSNRFPFGHPKSLFSLICPEPSKLNILPLELSLMQQKFTLKSQTFPSCNN